MEISIIALWYTIAIYNFFLKSFLNNTGKYRLFRCKNIHDVGLDCELWPGIGINFKLSSFLKHQCEIFGKVSDGLVRFIIRVGSRFYLGEDAAAHWRKINFFFGHNCCRRNNRFLTAFQSEAMHRNAPQSTAGCKPALLHLNVRKTSLQCWLNPSSQWPVVIKVTCIGTVMMKWCTV